MRPARIRSPAIKKTRDASWTKLSTTKSRGLFTRSGPSFVQSDLCDDIDVKETVNQPRPKFPTLRFFPHERKKRRHRQDQAESSSTTTNRQTKKATTTPCSLINAIDRSLPSAVNRNAMLNTRPAKLPRSRRHANHLTRANRPEVSGGPNIPTTMVL